MKTIEDKAKFIQLRAEGRSYAFISSQLNISKSTCSAWENEMSAAITERKGETLEELYDSYGMVKEARIRQLGDTLNGINEAIASMDFSTMAPEKLLDFKLKYLDAMKSEYVKGKAAFSSEEEITPHSIIKALGGLLNRVQAGEVTTEQAQKESIILSNLLKAYDTVEVKAKLEALESILESR